MLNKNKLKTVEVDNFTNTKNRERNHETTKRRIESTDPNLPGTAILQWQ